MGHGARLGQHIFGKDARQLVLADHHLHIDAEVVGIAQNFDHRPTGGRVGVGQLVISTSTTRPSRIVIAARRPRLRCPARGAAWRTRRHGGQLLAGGNQNGCVMRSSKGHDEISLRAVEERA
jgi:hypothetical protein